MSDTKRIRLEQAGLTETEAIAAWNTAFVVERQHLGGLFPVAFQVRKLWIARLTASVTKVQYETIEKERERRRMPRTAQTWEELEP